MARNKIVTFAVAYQGYHEAIRDGRNYVTWQDMLVRAADELGIKDEEMEGLRDHRAEVKRRDDDFLAQYMAK